MRPRLAWSYIALGDIKHWFVFAFVFFVNKCDKINKGCLSASQKKFLSEKQSFLNEGVTITSFSI